MPTVPITRSQALLLHRVPLWTIAREYLWLGLTGFGGGLHARFYHLAVSHRGWLNDEEFAEAVATASLAPGANSCNLGGEIARRLRGPAGMVVAYLALILPGTLFVIAAADVCARCQHVPMVVGALRGLEAAAAGLILFSFRKLVTSKWKRRDFGVALLTWFVFSALHLPLVMALVLMGTLSYALGRGTVE